MQLLMSLFKISLVLLIISSCSRTSTLLNHQQNPDDIKEFNYLGNNRDGYIALLSGKTIHAENIRLSEDTLYYNPVSIDSLKYAITDQIKYVYFMDHLVSTFDGFLFGFLGGAIGGRLYVDKGSEMEGLAILGIAAGGAAVGSVAGAIKGSKLKYQFQKDKK